MWQVLATEEVLHKRSSAVVVAIRAGVPAEHVRVCVRHHALRRLRNAFGHDAANFDTDGRQRLVEEALGTGLTFGEVIDEVGDSAFRRHLSALRDLGRVAKARSNRGPA